MKKTTILLLAVLLMTACDDDSLKTNPIDSNILIELREILGTETNTFSLFCQTEKIYPCCNYPILTDLNLNSNSLNVHFTEVQEGGICLTALGPATTEINLSALKNGSYDIALNNGKLNNSGTLTVTDTKVELQVNGQNGIKITNPILQRVPANTYWGMIGYSSADNASKVNDFLDKLTKAGALFDKQTPGYYFHYEIDKNGEMADDPDELTGYYFHKKYIFQHIGDEEAFKKTVQELLASYNDELHISLYTYKGQYIYSWTNPPVFSSWNYY